MTKNKKGQLGVVGIVMLFVGIVFGLALLSPIFDIQNQMTDKQAITDETTDLSSTGCLTGDGQVNESNALCNITVTNAPTGWKTTECPLTSVVVSNDTTALTVDTDYVVFASSGVIQMLNTTETENGTIGNDVLVDYSYCADGYNTDSGSRSVAGLIGLFAALALIAFVFDRMGIVNLQSMLGR